MIRLFTLIIITLINSCTMKGQSDKIVFTIDFQDYFEQDTVTFKINDCVVFEDLILTSDESVGLTSVQIFLYEKEENLILLYDENNTAQERKLGKGRKKNKIQYKFDKARKEYKMEILLNGKLYLFDGHFNKGKYLGFDKTKDNKLKLHQSKSPFEYD